MDNIQDKMIFKDTDEFMAPFKDGKYAIYSNKEQKFITDYLFEKISYIPVRNYFVVRKDGQNMVIDIQGNKIDFPIYYPTSTQGSVFFTDIVKFSPDTDIQTSNNT